MLAWRPKDGVVGRFAGEGAGSGGGGEGDGDVGRPPIVVLKARPLTF